MCANVPVHHHSCSSKVGSDSKSDGSSPSLTRRLFIRQQDSLSQTTLNEFRLRKGLSFSGVCAMISNKIILSGLMPLSVRCVPLVT